MRQLLLGICICGLSLSQAFAQDTITIAVFGDSLAAGYGVAPEDSFPAQLESKLKSNNYNVQVINDGVSGDTTVGGVSRVDSVLEQKPQIAIIILGGNDLLRAIPPAETKSNLDTIMGRFHQAHIKMLIAGQKAPLTLGFKYAGDYNDIFCDLAKKYDAECYAFFLEGLYNHPDLMQGDGIHPNKQGVETVLNRMYPQIVKLIKK